MNIKMEETEQVNLSAPTNGHLDVSTLETWLWDAACAIRGTADAPKYKDFILPLVFYKRLSDVFDDEFSKYIKELGDEKIAHEVIEADHKDALKNGRKPVVRFYIPHKYNWNAIRHHSADGSLGEFITEGMREVARLNPDLQGVVDVKDFNERQSGQRTLDDDRLSALIEILNRHKLGLKDTEPDVLGRAYEYLLRKFAEGQGQSAGEFYTPKEVAWLMGKLIDARAYTTVYDPTCGSGGLLIKARLFYEQKHKNERSKAPKLYGQEINHVTFAMAKMNMFLHDYNDSYFAIGDTFTKPGFATKGAGLKKFDYVVANPMWNQDNYNELFYESDSWNRFKFGYPPKSSADWGWAQHIFSSLNETGKAAVILDTGAVSRGSGGNSLNKEKVIRKAFVDNDYLESVILLPDNLFYNTTAPGMILLLNKNKPKSHKKQFLLINASRYFVREKPKNILTEDGITAITRAYQSWEEKPKLSKIITFEQVQETDYNLNPAQYVEVTDGVTHRTISEIMGDLKKVKSDREKADSKLSVLLEKIGTSYE